jgi:hypothetical protein
LLDSLSERVDEALVPAAVYLDARDLKSAVLTASLIPCVRAEERNEYCVRLGSSGGKTRPNYSCYQDWLCVSSLRLTCVKLRTISTSNGVSGRLNVNSRSAFG